MIVSIILIAIFSIPVLVLATIVIMHIVRAKEQTKTRMMEEYDLIKPGDIYECKGDVDKYGYSKTNPYRQLRYQVIDKKDGWVRFKHVGPEGVDNTECFASITEIICKEYKCINR